MQTEAQIRNRLVKKILEIPAKELKPLSDFVSQLERGAKDNRANVLSFSGAWKDIDNDVFKDLTDNLNQNRQSQRDPIDG